MRKYLFEFKDDGKEDNDYEIDYATKEHTKYVDYVYFQDPDQSDCEEFAYEASKFLLARGFHPFTVNGLVYIKWQINYKDPDYNEEYLVSLKGNNYASCAQFKDGKWFDILGIEIDKEIIEAWADLPIAVHK